MSDLRKAAEMALEVLSHSLGHSNEAQKQIDKTKQALRQALAQPEQEPVAWMHIEKNEIVSFDTDKEECEKCEHCVPLYTAPPKREWVGLTDEERMEIVFKRWWNFEDEFDIEGFSRAIEAKLKEKNGG